jgi:hypothetical protein
MKTLRILGLGLLAMTLAGAAGAAPRGAQGSEAQPFRPYRPYQGQSTYGGDPVATTPRRTPYENNGPGGFKPYHNGFKPNGPDGTIKPRAGTFGGAF